jgi:hypothetical protein
MANRARIRVSRSPRLGRPSQKEGHVWFTIVPRHLIKFLMRVPRVTAPSRGCSGAKNRDRDQYPQGVLPLRQARVSAVQTAEDARFELARGCPQHAFQACALGH